MPPFNEQNRGSSTSDVNRLETPSKAGYRDGMSASGVIGRKLGRVYSVDTGVPHEMDVMLRQLRSKLDATDQAASRQTTG